MRLYAHVMPVCSIDAPAVSGVGENNTTHCRSINRTHRHNMSIQTHAATPPEEK